MRGPRTALRFLSVILIALGIGIIAIVVALHAYAGYEQATAGSQSAVWDFDSDPSAGIEAIKPVGDAATEASAATAADTNATTEAVAADTAPTPEASPHLGGVEQTPTPRPTVPIPTPTATPQPKPPRWIRIPSIDVDSGIVEAVLKNGEWQVPKFVAGHLQGTANPGENGNVVLTGHVQSISAGNVFARIQELNAGDKVSLYVDSNEFPYRVRTKFVVKNNDMSVVQPTSTPVLTLITCTGTWNPFTRDYSERLIVLADPVGPGDLD